MIVVYVLEKNGAVLDHGARLGAQGYGVELCDIDQDECVGR
jgi:hypothetical protein